MPHTHLIIGSSAAALGALNLLRTLDESADIICITAQQERPFNTCFLADHLSGIKTIEQLQMLPHAVQDKRRIHMLFNTRVTFLNPHEKLVITSDGQKISYDSLLIATGTSPYMPPIDGIADGHGFFTFHTLADCTRILNFIQKHTVRKAVIIGGGLTGLECADAFSTRGVAVAVVEKQPAVLNGVVAPAISAVIQQAMQRNNIALYADETVVEILRAQHNIVGVRLASGTILDADMVICAVGLKPNSQLADGAGIALQHNRIVVNEQMQTSIPGIYAAGDVVLVPDQRTACLVPSCTWPDAMFQGLVAAHNMAGRPKKYPGVLPVLQSAFFGLNLSSCWVAPGEHQVEVQQSKQGTFLYARERGQLRGFCLVGARLPVVAELKRGLLTTHYFP